ncbi:HypC/HybG/HupF family hydrogenase formation chaperone [Roseibium sp.]|uniref:HypC/HybG/HupF family hydrogenase formation chaperone n=1 Tax=Roseibium sp. TaxID=1936156 RepID=UPI003B51C7C3
MCLGIPMQVISSDFGFARCRADDGEHDIDVRLVGPVEPGTWVLTFLGAARDILDAETARRTADALEALRLVADGHTDVDHLFEDLIAQRTSAAEDAQATKDREGTGNVFAAADVHH